MIVPKRFKLHEMAFGAGLDEYVDDVVRVTPSALIAVSREGLAYVPVDPADGRADMPRLERGETAPDVIVAAKAFQVATQGTSGEGTVRIAEMSTEVRAGPDKPWTRFVNPTGAFPPYEEAIRDAVNPHRQGRLGDVVLRLNAGTLSRIAAAIGADEGVCLYFTVNEHGSVDAELGQIVVRPLRQPLNSPFGILMAIVVQ